MMRKIVAIDAPGGSGKSTLAEKFQALLPNSYVVGTDFFCYPPINDGSGRWWPEDIKGYGVDWERLRDQVMQPFKNNTKDIRYQSLNWDNWELDWLTIPDDTENLIVEGLYSFREELRPFVDYSIWMDADTNSVLERIKDRDGDEILHHWTTEFIPISTLYQQEHKTRECVDLILDFRTYTDVDLTRAVNAVNTRNP